MSSENNCFTTTLRFPKFSGEWIVDSLGQIADVCYGTRVVQEKDGGSIYPVYGGGGATFKMDIYNREDCVVVARFAVSQTCTRFVKGKFFLNDSGLTLIAHEGLLQSYLNWFIISRNDEIYKKAEGMAQKNLSMPSFKALSVCFPKSNDEQEKIASIFNTFEDLIIAQEKKINTLKEKKKGLMQQLFPMTDETSPRLRFPGFVDEWEEKKLSDVFDRLMDKNSEDNKNVLTISAQYGLISQLDFFKKSVSASDVTGYYLLHKGDFAYNKSSSQGKPVGAIKPLKLYDKGVVSTLYICFRCKDPNTIGFWEQYFDAGVFDKEIMTIAQEGARNHGLLNVPTNDFFGLSVKMPKPEEQQKIAECLSALDEHIASESAKIESLKDHKKGLMQQLFPQPSK